MASASATALFTLAAGIVLADPVPDAPDPATAAPTAQSTPSDEDAPILERLKAGDVARAAALADAALARDENDLHMPPGPRAQRLERLALRFYEAGTPESATLAEGYYTKAVALREQDARDPAALATVLHDFSGVLFNRGAYERAGELESRALKIRERALPPDAVATARSRRDLGLIAMAQGRLSEAEQSLEPAMRVFEAAVARRQEAAPTPGEAAVAQPQEAAPTPGEAAVAQPQGSAPTPGEAAVVRPETARTPGESPPAPTDSSSATDEASPPEDWMELAIGLNYLAELRRQQGDYEAAASIYERLVRESESRIGASNPQFPYFLNNLAGVYKDQGRWDEAETLLRRSLALRRSASPTEPMDIARATLNLAELYREQGKLAEAEPLYLAALEGARGALGKDNPELFEFVDQLAVLRRDEGGHTQNAEMLMLQALALAVKGFGAEHPRVAQCYLDLAGLSRSRGRCESARAYLDRALAIREKVFGPSHPDVAEVLVASAACRPSDLAGRRVARTELDRALVILKGSEAHPDVEIDALEARARLFPSDRARADKDLEDAMGVVERMRPHRGGGESVRASFFGRHKRLYDLAIRRDVEQGRTDHALATAERARARVLLDQLAAAGVRDASAGDPELSRRLGLARTQLAETRQRIGYEQSREDLPAKDRMRRVAGLETQLARDTRDFQELHDEARNTSAAWRGAIGADLASVADIRAEIVPRKGWLLFYQVGGERSYLFAVPPADADPASPEAATARGANPEGIRVFALKTNPQDASLLGISAGPLTEASLSRALLGARRKGTGRGGASGAGTAGTVGILARLASPQGGAARGIGGITTGSDPGDRALHALWRALVPAELWPRLRSASQVLIVPDGPLFLLPFEALVVAPGSDPTTTRYWLDDGPVLRYAPSASFLLQLQRLDAARRATTPAVPGPERVLSVADPDYAAATKPLRAPVVGRSGAPGSSNEDARATTSVPASASTGAPATDTSPAEPALRGGVLERLPGTAHESDLVREALAGVADVVVLRGAAAREPAVRAELAGKRYLHIATHALVDQEGGELFAALALTPPPAGDPRGEDDGFLQLFEIYDLRMDCDLAVLSACSSNTGKVVAGEGIFALSRGFLLGGARRVVASQWSVEDLSTADLVGELFRRIAASEKAGQPVEAALALRDAKRFIRRQRARAHPFFWAPFVITGVE